MLEARPALFPSHNKHYLQMLPGWSLGIVVFVVLPVLEMYMTAYLLLLHP